MDKSSGRPRQRVTRALAAGIAVVSLAAGCAIDDDRGGHMRGDVGVLAGDDRGSRGGIGMFGASPPDCRWVVAMGRALERSHDPVVRRLGHDLVRAARSALRQQRRGVEGRRGAMHARPC